MSFDIEIYFVLDSNMAIIILHASCAFNVTCVIMFYTLYISIKVLLKISNISYKQRKMPIIEDCRQK